jgi:hypothetical protein
VLSRFCDDIPAEDLRALTRKTYTADVYCNARAGDNTADITPLRTLGEEGGTKLQLLGLSNGPTLAFKDMAMQLLGNLFEYALKRAGEAEHPGRHLGRHRQRGRIRDARQEGIRVFMLSPHRKMSAFQTAQMFSLQDPNIFNIAIEGVFDDARTSSRPSRTTTRSRRASASAPSTRSTGRAWWPRWCTTSRAGCWRPAVRDRRCRSACRRATSATSAPATSRA